MRLFIAIDVPLEVDEYLFSVQKRLDDNASLLKPVKSFHLTLKFLGETSEIEIAKIIEGLSDIRFNRFALETSDIGVFLNKEHINVIWVGLKESGKVIELQMRIEDCLSEFKIKKDFRFHSHITLARVALMKDKIKFMDNLKKIQTERKVFDVEKFILYQSMLKQDGPEYIKIKEFSAA